MVEEEVKAKVKIERAPPGTEPFIPRAEKRIVVEFEPEVVAPPPKRDGLLFPLKGEWAVPPPMELPGRTVVMDIETTGINPWNSRIICICAQDTAVFVPEPTVFHNMDERMMVQEFLDWYKRNKFTKIIGYNVSFDHRFIFSRCMQYVLPAPEFLNSELHDMMQVMRQVKREFVYSFNKAGRLEDWTIYLWNRERKLSYEQILDYFVRGEIDPIIEHCNDAVNSTLSLYMLSQFVASPGP